MVQEAFYQNVLCQLTATHSKQNTLKYTELMKSVTLPLTDDKFPFN